MTKTLLAVFALTCAGISTAQAQRCQTNFKTDGVAMVTAINYRTWQAFPNISPAKALDNVARAVAAEGFLNVRIDKSLGAVTALLETSGSGRPQTLRLVVRKIGSGSKVDAVFMVQPGQVAPEGPTRDALCRVVEGATG